MRTHDFLYKESKRAKLEREKEERRRRREVEIEFAPEVAFPQTNCFTKESKYFPQTNYFTRSKHFSLNKPFYSSQNWQDLALATVPGADFDPSARAFDMEELRPQPIIRKRAKQFVSSEKKDGKYWESRTKNTIAARRWENTFWSLLRSGEKLRTGRERLGG